MPKFGYKYTCGVICGILPDGDVQDVQFIKKAMTNARCEVAHDKNYQIVPELIREQFGFVDYSIEHFVTFARDTVSEAYDAAIEELRYLDYDIRYYIDLGIIAS